LEVADGMLDAAEKDGGALAFEQAEGGGGGAESEAGGQGDVGRAVVVEGVNAGGLMEERIPAMDGGVDEAVLLGVVVDEAEGLIECSAGFGRERGGGRSLGHAGEDTCLEVAVRG